MLSPETQKPEGFDIDIAAAVAKALGVTSTHKNISFDGLVPALQAGQCDAIISGFYDKPDRRKVVDFANYAITGTALIVKADSDLKLKTLADLSGRKIAVGIGTAGEGLMQETNSILKAEGRPEIMAVALPTSAEAFQQLAANLVDGYLGSSDQAAYYNKQNPGSVKLAGPAVNQFPTGIATLPSNRELHEAFEAAIAKIKANGEYDRILKTWSFEDLALR
ncbi:ABC transporter substrate-binding protein [Sinorhizobium psoraleae]|uniref:ABC transporter substrate-binding protein n=1 Tax=Sinorhizobium psoraleae TaxID=520838 RepID=A0ABT4K9K4_9HYPH|nr:ABC transporter substrate-binding protein [Sinorhizobium psoraleae]MCZ4088625.1 ABC transporter substrate-binding protein [Sinorhizobium psoraleae]